MIIENWKEKLAILVFVSLVLTMPSALLFIARILVCH